MILVLDILEDENMAYALIKELAADPNKWDRLRNDLVYQTEIPDEDLKELVEIYLQ